MERTCPVSSQVERQFLHPRTEDMDIPIRIVAVVVEFIVFLLDGMVNRCLLTQHRGEEEVFLEIAGIGFAFLVGIAAGDIEGDILPQMLRQVKVDVCVMRIGIGQESFVAGVT